MDQKLVTRSHTNKHLNWKKKVDIDIVKVCLELASMKFAINRGM